MASPPIIHANARIDGSTLFDEDLPNDLAYRLAEELGFDTAEYMIRAELYTFRIAQDGIAFLNGPQPYVTARMSELTPFIAAYDLSLIDISDVLSLPTSQIAGLIQEAWGMYDLEFARGYCLSVRKSGNHTLKFAESLVRTHPLNGEHYHDVSLGALVLESSLRDLERPLKRRNFYPLILPEEIPNAKLVDRHLPLLVGRTVVVMNPSEDVLHELFGFNCCVMDISRVSDLKTEELADAIYLAWDTLNLRTQASCHVILNKEGGPNFRYSDELDRISV